MPDLSFKEWVEQKDEEARSSEKVRRRQEWLQAYQSLKNRIREWLGEDGGDRIRFESEWIRQNERALGSYNIEGFRVEIGDSSVHFVPVSRNVIARINPPEGGEFRGAGRVDVTDGARKYHLYRTIQDQGDVWYVVDEDRRRATPLSKKRLQEILMDLMT
jgi:hypothetical protein